MKIWLVPDSHLFHSALVQLEERPEDFTEQIIANWLSMVSEGDVVLHLGDVIMGHDKIARLTPILTMLPGVKILIRGNHDSPRPSQWYEAGFDLVTDGIRMGEIYFSHEPTRRLPEFVRLNVHGHMHRNGHRLGAYSQFPWYTDHAERYLLAEIETTLAPIELSEFLYDHGYEKIDLDGHRPYDYLIPELNNTVV